MPESLPENGKTLRRQIEKLRSGMVGGRITGAELYKLFSNQSLGERTAIAEAAGLHAADERDEKGNKIVVWS